MTDAEIDTLIKARGALARRRNAIASSIGKTDLAAVKAADELTRVLLAIEAVDRALVDAGRPYMPEPAVAPSPTKGHGKAPEPDGSPTSASRAKDRLKAAVQADREHSPTRRPRRQSSTQE